jgi:sugar fermentation stimulation protein A
MKYSTIVEGKFIARPNRFIAQVKIEGKLRMAHVKNTGRCKELLVEGNRVYLEDFSRSMGTRTLAYSLIGVEKGSLMINMDSQAPNKVVKEALADGLELPDMGRITTIKPEAVWGESRLDFYIADENGKEGYIEVKGVTLEDDGVASFPDAPTERGIKHLHELIKLAESGYNTYVLFVIQMSGIKYFQPNEERHPEFASTLRLAEKSGVKILAYDCIVTRDTLVMNKPVPVKL